MSEAEHQRYDPFRDDELVREIAQFQPRGADEVKARPELDALAQLAAARGFDERGGGRRREVKEPLKALQFRLPQSQVDEFHQLAYEVFGPKHGAKTALFLKMWEAYLSQSQQQDDSTMTTLG